ncbi:MAG TPA: DUF374 domain-containing protein [bacterium]|nr:DUF374 domain-containing protein [bacterium]HEX67725.1 DUF374 domain-containing protein [bacterium]
MRKFIRKILPYLIIFYLHIIAYTIRWKGKLKLPSTNFILAFWHNRLFLFLAFYIRYLKELPFYALVSPSRDGEIIARVAEKLGIKTIRGSSGHFSPASAKKMLKVLNRRGNLIIIPDGPRGPRYKVKEGIIRISQKSAKPIQPLRFSPKRFIAFPSWDKLILPLPFSQIEFQFPFPIKENIDKKILEKSLF